ncbi:phage baseplate assembly protein V [Caballeronia sp. S22]|uniref:phage baseplate assembly protein V n=1 Tax=Caballeronia sp. S22 TaxID=3137182 RepID=UPI0035310CA4
MDIEVLKRRIYSLVGRGRVKYVDDSGPVQALQVLMDGLETPDSLRVAEFGFASNPPIDSDAIALHIAGDRSAGVVLGTNHQPSRPTGLAAGETMLYSQDGKQVYLTASGGIVVEAKGQPVTVNDATTVVINAATKVRMVTPRLECTGDIIDNCDTNTRTMSGMRAVANGHTHKIVNVQTGGSTIESNAPDQTE